jgi:hypothetical protein
MTVAVLTAASDVTGRFLFRWQVHGVVVGRLRLLFESELVLNVVNNGCDAFQAVGFAAVFQGNHLEFPSFTRADFADEIY